MAIFALVVVMLLAPGARGEVTPGTPDESIHQAYGPIKARVTYSGAFDNTNYVDVDYLKFDVATAGQTLEFTVANTTQSCNDPNNAGCPVYATLMDQTDSQVGGDASGAGTIASANDTEVFDWTFAQPGTYYLLIESRGDLSPASPSYQVSFVPKSGTGGGGGTSGGGTPPPIVKSLKVVAQQRGPAVIATFVLGQPAARMRATLVASQRLVATVTRRNLSAGTYRLVIRLPTPWRHKLKLAYHLALRLKLTVVTASGQQVSFTRRVTLNA